VARSSFGGSRFFLLTGIISMRITTALAARRASVWLVLLGLLVACTGNGASTPPGSTNPEARQAIGSPGPPPAEAATATGKQRELAEVTRVVDGDTIQVSLNGESVSVRYLLIDTPETVDPRTTVQCMGREASARNHELVEGRTVFLEADVTDRDRFGRLLRYVYLQDGRMVNEVLVREGFAAVSTVPPDIKHLDALLAAQGEAVRDSLGLWGVCGSATITPLH
jgi:micrococcal nuclease